MNRTGELFLGQSFGALDSERPPEYMENVDRHFINMGIKGSFPLIHKILTYLPIDEVRKLINASDNLREVSGQQKPCHESNETELFAQYGRKAFYNYIDDHGRQPTRKDLLTKMLTVETESDSTTLSDLQMYAEVGNLVFAGTGISNPLHITELS